MKLKINFKQLFRHFIIFLILTVVFITLSALTYQYGPHISSESDFIGNHPSPYIPPGYNESLGNILLDQHSHTKYSDGVLTVEESVKWHLSMGYNAFVISDHHNIDNLPEINEMSEKYESEIIIIPGMEWSTSRMHFNFLGIEEWNLTLPSYPTNQDIQDAIDYVHAQGGVVSVNHIPWSFGTAEPDPSREELLAMGVDFIEIINDDNDPGEEFDYPSYQFCLANNGSMGMITGTDMHAPNFLGTGAVHGWTQVYANNFSREAIMDQLRNKNTSIIYYPKGVVSSRLLTLQPFYFAGKIISEFFVISGSVNTIGAVIFFSYYFITFALIEGIIALNKLIKTKIDLKKKKK